MAMQRAMQGSDSDIALDCTSPELLSLMKEKLPGYVVKCFLASGYDSEENIACMDDDAITTIENFVEKRFSNESGMHSQFLPNNPGSVFEFPPGHKASIRRFIKQMKENYNTKHSQIFNCKQKSSQHESTVSNTRPSTPSSSEMVHHSKKRKICSISRISSETSFHSDSKVHSHVKSQINEWMDSHAKGLLKDLTEEHYSIISGKGTGVNVHCKLCNKDIKLQPSSKNDRYKISNWTKHVKPCFLLNFDPGQTKLVFNRSVSGNASECTTSSSYRDSASSPKQTIVFSNVKDREVAVPTTDTAKWSREERAKRQLLKAADEPCQSCITDYFTILNDIEKLLQANAKLSNLVQQYPCTSKDMASPVVNLNMSFTPILKQLVLNAEKNAESVPNHRRHPDILKKFATALLIYAGPLTYEFIHSNMPEALPSLRTVQRSISCEYKSFSEGIFYFDDLLAHIKHHNTSTVISIGEDATRVIARIDYDCETDRCVGFVLPVDSDGLPLVDSFLAVSYKAIEDMFLSATKAKYAYVYMAQPMSLNAPPFCLACIGSDNKFTAQHVLLRWKYIYEECSRRGLIVVSFGGDGDSRVMSAMKESTSLLSLKEPLLNSIPFSPAVPRIPTAWKEWFQIHPRSTVSYVQDVVHVGVKLKSRLLKPSIRLPMGPQFCASGNHLQMIRMAYGKDEHNLRERDVNHKDKQNFDAVLHIMNSSHLLETVPEAKGTFVYVEMMKCTVDSYLNKSLSPLERIEKAWYANFFARYWKEWISLSSQYTLKHNFLTSNAYLCIELNAHALITFLMNAHTNEKNHDVFLPWLLGSQSCERIFRSARSMSTVFSSVLNFSILGLLRRLHRLNIQAVLQADAELSGIKFPRVEKNFKKHGTSSYVAPSLAGISNKDICGAVESALKKAKETLSDLNMDILLKKHSKWDNVTCSMEGCEMDSDEDDDQQANYIGSEVNEEEIVSEIIKEVCEDDPVQVEKDLQSISTSGIAESKISNKLGKFSKCLAPVRLNSKLPSYCFTDNLSSTAVKSKEKAFLPFVEVTANDQTLSIRKTTAIWLLQENERVSSDRLFRVREKQPYSDLTTATTVASFTVPTVSNTVHIGDLCLFKLGTDWQLGRILQLSKYDTEKKRYNKPCNDQVIEVTKYVGVLCSWYSKLSNNEFELSKNSDMEYLSLENYICTLPESCIFKNGENPGDAIIFNEFSKPKNQSSLTTKQISITEECMESLLSIVETSVHASNQQTSGTECSSSTYAANPIVIAENNENETLPTKDLWTKCGGLSLGRKELQRLSNGKELIDLHINAFQNLLKAQFHAIGGLQSTLLQQKRSPLINKQKRNLQIIHITITQTIQHWAVLEIIDDSEIYLYDSAYTSVVGDGRQIISHLLNTDKDTLSVSIMDVGKQFGAADCGLYAIATLTCLAHDKDPCITVFQKEELRPHLQGILETGIVREFPSSQRRKRRSRILTTEVFEIHCICRMPDDGSKMVCCDECSVWFHATCVDYVEENSNNNKTWYCEQCNKMQSS